MAVFCDAVGFDFFLVQQRVVVAVQIPGGAAHHVGRRVVAQGDHLLDPLCSGSQTKSRLRSEVAVAGVFVTINWLFPTS